MALTVSTARNRSLVEYFSALVIAIIAAIAIAVVVSAPGNGQSDVALTSPASPSYSYDRSPHFFTLYLVDSQEKADGIMRSEQELVMSYVDNQQQPPARTSSVIVATTPEEDAQAEQLANLAAQEMMLSGTIFELVDLRGQ